MRVAVTGSTGLIGTALVDALRKDGHEVVRLVRPATSGAGVGGVAWDPAAGTIDRDRLGAVDAAVNLAGAGIGDKRWTPERKRLVLDSRVQCTRLVAETLAGMNPPPSVLVSGSAIHHYGDRGDEILTETSATGDLYLSEVTRQWEAAAAPAAEAGIRVVYLRPGMVLSRRGGGLGQMVPLFRWGLGGRFGSGRQWMPWITLTDAVGAIRHLLVTEVEGPVNVVAPSQVTNREFAATLGRVLRRPAVIPIPRLGPSLLLGAELARELLFTSQRAIPQALEQSGYQFEDPTLEAALSRMLGG